MTEDSAILEIIALREAWLAAVRNADADRLGSLVTDDVVVVHGDGRCVKGRNELNVDLRKGFESWRINQQVVDPEIAIPGNWAFEIAKVESTLIPIRGGDAIRTITTALVVLRKDKEGGWKVARVVGLVD